MLYIFRNIVAFVSRRLRDGRQVAAIDEQTPDATDERHNSYDDIAAKRRESELAELREMWEKAGQKRQTELREASEVKRRELRAIYESNVDKWHLRNAKQDAGESPTDFYKSRAWRSLRYDAFKRYGQRCSLCVRTPEEDGIVLHVDHIKPRSTHPDLALSIKNLQILCEDCNLGKVAKDSIKWR